MCEARLQQAAIMQLGVIIIHPCCENEGKGDYFACKCSSTTGKSNKLVISQHMDSTSLKCGIESLLIFIM